jgi:hypothetical protein
MHKRTRWCRRARRRHLLDNLCRLIRRTGNPVKSRRKIDKRRYDYDTGQKPASDAHCGAENEITSTVFLNHPEDDTALGGTGQIPQWRTSPPLAGRYPLFFKPAFLAQSVYKLVVNRRSILFGWISV